MKIKCPNCNFEIEMQEAFIKEMLEGENNEDVIEMTRKILGRELGIKYGKIYGFSNHETQKKIGELENSKKARKKNAVIAFLSKVAKTVYRRLGNAPNVGDNYKTSASYVEVKEKTEDGVKILLTNLKTKESKYYRIHLDGEKSTGEML